MNRRILSIIVFFSILLSACSGSDRALLEQADAVMEEHPDSAIGILQEIDREHISGKDLPYYALLMTQAQVKTDVPLDSDSLISIAYRKFGNDWWGDKGIRANFYTGEVFFNQDKQRDAMKFYLTAYEESKRLGNDYWRAKSAERISDIFSEAYNYNEAEKYMIEAAKLFNISQKEKNHMYALATLGIIYINDQKVDRAEILLDSLYKACATLQPKDSALSAFVRRPLIDILVRQNRLNEITEQDINMLESSSCMEEDIDNTILLKEIQAFENNEDSNSLMGTKSIEKYFPIIMSNEDKALLYYAKYQHEKKSGNLTKALSLIDSLLFYQSTLAEDIIKESVKSAEADFYSHKVDFEKRRSLYILIILVLIIFVFILILIIGWNVHKRRIQKHLQQLESVLDSMIELDLYANRMSLNYDELKKDVLLRDQIEKDLRNEIIFLEDQANSNYSSITKLKDEIQIRDTIVNRLENEIKKLKNKDKQNCSTIENLFKEKWATLNLLCDEYFELGDSTATRYLILKNLEKELKKIKTQKNITDIEKSVDLYMGGLITRLRIQCPFLKKDDITFLTLIYAGYSVRAVCLVTNIKYRNFYVKKYRLTKKILESEAPDKQLFIEKLKE